MSTTLTDEQRAIIAENKRKALERRAKLESERCSNLPQQQNSPNLTGPVPKRPNLNEAIQQQQKLLFPSNLTTAPKQQKLLFPSNLTTAPKQQQQTSSAKENLQPCQQQTNFSTSSGPSTSKCTNVNNGPFNPLKGYKAKVTVDFEVISSTEVQFTVNPYIDAVKNLAKTFKSTVYHLKEKNWTIGFSDYKSLVSALKALKDVDCTLKELPKWTNSIFCNNNLSSQMSRPLEEVDSEIQNSQIEKCLLDTLFPYQRAGVAFGLKKNGRLLIADEMGLGKTLQALSIARAYSSEWPLLIICPSSVKYSWKQQITKFLPTVDNIVIIEKGTDKIPTERTSNTVIIMSYDQTIFKEKELLSAHIYVIIFDESHLLKDGTAKRTKTAMNLARIANRKILLSGTPALSRPAELFTQLRLIDPKLFTSFKDFADRYCQARMGKYGYEAKGAEHLQELATILNNTVMIRRLKKDVLKELPDKRREILYLSGDKLQNRLKELEQARKAYVQAEQKPSSKGNDELQNKLLTFFQETGLCKADCIADYILEKYFYPGAPNVKLLLFGHHGAVLDTFSIRFNLAGIKTIRIDGGTKGKDREKNCKKFQEDPQVRVAILSITAAGTGITLTAANTVIFAELYWNPGILFQAEDRAHRVGQKSDVSVCYILARKTADDVIWPKIQEKIMVIGNMKLNSEKLDKLDKNQLVLEETTTKITDYFTVLEI